jgi:hypothetical protein
MDHWFRFDAAVGGQPLGAAMLDHFLVDRACFTDAMGLGGSSRSLCDRAAEWRRYAEARSSTLFLCCSLSNQNPRDRPTQHPSTVQISPRIMPIRPGKWPNSSTPPQNKSPSSQQAVGEEGSNALSRVHWAAAQPVTDKTTGT